MHFSDDTHWFLIQGELLGQGACKRVYRGFDDELGIEVRLLALAHGDMIFASAYNTNGI